MMHGEAYLTKYLKGEEAKRKRALYAEKSKVPEWRWVFSCSKIVEYTTSIFQIVALTEICKNQ